MKPPKQTIAWAAFVAATVTTFSLVFLALVLDIGNTTISFRSLWLFAGLFWALLALISVVALLPLQYAVRILPAAASLLLFLLSGFIFAAALARWFFSIGWEHNSDEFLLGIAWGVYANHGYLGAFVALVAWRVLSAGQLLPLARSADGVSRIVVFDGVCNFCNGAVNFIIRRDPAAKFQFAPMQSEAAQRLMEQHGVSAEEDETMLLIEGDRCLVRTDAALAIARELNWPWPAFSPFRYLPQGFRDWFYRKVARNRYRWFGRKNQCMVPDESVQARFV